MPLGGLGCGWEDWGAVGRTGVPLGGVLGTYVPIVGFISLHTYATD